MTKGLKAPGIFTMKSVKFVGLPPSTSPESGSPISTHSLVSSKSEQSEHFYFILIATAI